MALLGQSQPERQLMYRENHAYQVASREQSSELRVTMPLQGSLLMALGDRRHSLTNTVRRRLDGLPPVGQHQNCSCYSLQLRSLVFLFPVEQQPVPGTSDAKAS